MLEPIKKSRLYEGVVTQILKLIEDGTIKPGEQLPAEREIALKLKVSRPSVREALRSLEMLGYLESKIGAGGGNYVKKITIKNVLQPFSSVLLQQGINVIELLEVRCILETEIARVVSKRRTKEDLQNIETAINEMAAEIDKGEVGLWGNIHFHESLAKAMQNEIFTQILHMCSQLLAVTSNDILVEMQDPKKSLEEHKLIYLAIKQRKAQRASQLMKQHIMKAQNRLKLAMSAKAINNHSKAGSARNANDAYGR